MINFCNLICSGIYNYWNLLCIGMPYYNIACSHSGRLHNHTFLITLELVVYALECLITILLVPTVADSIITRALLHWNLLCIGMPYYNIACSHSGRLHNHTFLITLELVVYALECLITILLVPTVADSIITRALLHWNLLCIGMPYYNIACSHSGRLHNRAKL